MNERIHQIAEQIYGSAATEQEIKFAELLIRDCIKAASDPGDRWIVGNTWHDGVRSSVCSIQDQFDLDRSFGIEEW